MLLIVTNQLRMICAFTISDIHYMLQRCPSWSVQYGHKFTNRIAHNLSKLACNLVGNSIWVENYPLMIEDVIQQEKLCITHENE